ncbi:WD repeat-containing protein 46-like [Saccoglossus kowalevskii]|uniref:WD repeat-containing protein 46-like n=1 Tax=Saccoglossus kowalevskii TaxID=10224 RepID=A0ABM0GZN1_SACKO|nr:PREDICTED: WD repeat-containing protein 46-like [Saccoglossus kowalevskii]
MADDEFVLPKKANKKRTQRYYDTSKDKTPTLDKDEELKDGSHRNKKHKFERGSADPFKGPAPVPKEKVTKYVRGKKIDLQSESIPHVKHRHSMKRLEDKYAEAVKSAARSELLLTEEAGFLEADEDEETHQISQKEIRQAVDISSATKNFDLTLNQFGPYKLDYTRNGRHLLLGGRKGHLAAMDWVTKRPSFEINVMETIQEVQWLHIETMLAVAQKKWLYIYDNQGTELHCVNKFNDVLKMQFLPYHFLLATASATGFLKYLDVSIGREVASIRTKLGRLYCMKQNPHNAIIHLGHTNGTVTLWSPNLKGPIVKMLCHKSAVRSIAIDKSGLYMATSGQDRQLKIFDIRTFKPLQVYRIASGATELSFSQRGLLASACGNIVDVYKDCCTQSQDKPYMMHKMKYNITDLQFCPYEDVLGVTHTNGFESLLIPGAGEANFDALEQNPYQSKKARREWEVKALLEKIQPEMITMDTHKIAEVDMVTMEQKLAERKEILGYIPAAKFQPKHKMKGKSSSTKTEQRKKGVIEENKRDALRKESEKVQDSQKKVKAQEKEEIKLGKRSALDRFQTKSS